MCILDVNKRALQNSQDRWNCNKIRHRKSLDCEHLCSLYYCAFRKQIKGHCKTRRMEYHHMLKTPSTPNPINQSSRRKANTLTENHQLVDTYAPLYYCAFKEQIRDHCETRRMELQEESSPRMIILRIPGFLCIVVYLGSI